MSKTLVIVESPGKAKKISKILGDDFIVRATIGHIVDLTTDGKGNLGVNIEKGFVPKYQIIPDKKDKVKAIISAASSVDKIYVASDPDREGEAIAWHLADILEKTNKPIERVKTTSPSFNCESNSLLYSGTFINCGFLKNN